jgi:hypothetical protein
MGRAAVLATPSFILQLQPFWESCFLDVFHVSHYTLSVRVLYIRNEHPHEFASLQFTALIAKFIAFLVGTSLDATGGTEASGFLTFTAVTLLGIVNFPCLCCQQDRASAAIHAAISMQDKVHDSFSPYCKTRPLT